VEVDAGRKWKTSDPATYEGVYYGIPRLQSLCNDYGVKPVYLVSPAVMVDTKSVDVLASLDIERCELGTHLHGEYIDPDATFAGPDFSGCDPSEMQCNYDEDIELGKLKNLTARFVALFGREPRSFRAGRFGARGWTIACLQQLGYTHDTSVTPFRNWYDIVDFSKPGSLEPYYPAVDDICSIGHSTVLEVPVSITPELQWLRPTSRFSDLQQCEKVIDWYEAHTQPTVLCAMFHNVELVPGKSPYCKTEEDCEAMFQRIEGVFRMLRERNYRHKTLREVTIDG
ncbi:MAG: hypothetical protein ACR2RL_13440, partial [Gammaproteobacteria bacterium]